MSRIRHHMPLRASRGIALMAALVLFALSLAVIVPPSADALPACGTHKRYYSSSSYTTQVGYRYWNCDGVLVTSSGTTTPWATTNSYCCPLQ